jgi:hypothetical protein
MPCQKAWCARCYTPRSKPINFFTYEPEDEDGYVWIKKGDEKRFMVARNGDNLLTHFQCDLCVFRNLHQRDPVLRSQRDDLALCVYRRANLDAFWSRERATVSSNRLWVRRGVDLSQAVDQQDTYPALGPMPLADVTGHGVAALELMASTRPGAYHASHSQFDTIRKLRSSFSSFWMASPRGVTLSAGRDLRGGSIRLSDCPTDSEWFRRFSQGMKKRMGQDVRPQLGFSVEVMLALLARLEESWKVLPLGKLKDDTLGALAYSSLSYANALRGNEGFKLDLNGLVRHIKRGRQVRLPHVVAPLLGRFKGRDGERLHLLFMVPVTHSGIKVRCYLEWLVARRSEQGFLHGPAFCDQAGEEIESGVYEGLILEALHVHQDWERAQFSNDHKLLEGVDIDERYGIFRSFKRGAITRAQEAGVSESDVNRVGQWRRVEGARGRQVGGSMREHYTELVQMLDARLRFSRAL